MSDENACFLHSGEIYYKIGATQSEITMGLKFIVNDSLYDEEELSAAIKAQHYLVHRQMQLITKKHCE